MDLLWRVLNGFLGIAVMLGIAFACSFNRKKINWRLVGLGIAMQFGFALLILKTPFGQQFFMMFNDAILKLLSFSDQGASFLFGRLTSDYSIGANFAFSVLPTIIFFSSMISVLYYLGVMQKIVQAFAWIMQKILGTSGAETLSCSANIFVGQTEAPLLVKPFVETMTQSELLTVMTGGFATVAGGVMAAYVGMLSHTFPDIAGHLLSASIMNAPGAIIMSKIVLPEEEEPLTKGEVKVELPIADANIVDAAANGAGQGLQLALNVGAMLLAFISLIGIINFGFQQVGDLIFRDHTIKYSQVVSWNGLLTDLKDHKSPGTQRIWEALGKENQDLLAAWEPGAANDANVREQILVGMNSILTKKDFYDAQVFDISRLDMEMKPVMSDLAKKQGKDSLSGGKLMQFNRYLMEMVIPQSLMKRDLALSLGTLLGWIFAPIAFVLGIPWKDCIQIGSLMGKKLAINEFVAYAELADMLSKGVRLDPKSVVIATYALCGFANFSSIAIQIGGIGGIAPSRRADLARLGMYGLIAGTLAGFQSASIAGMLTSQPRLNISTPDEMKQPTSSPTEEVKESGMRTDFNTFAAKHMGYEIDKADYGPRDPGEGVVAIDNKVNFSEKAAASSNGMTNPAILKNNKYRYEFYGRRMTAPQSLSALDDKGIKLKLQGKKFLPVYVT